jgi:hypothetical protein
MLVRAYQKFKVRRLKLEREPGYLYFVELAFK